MAGGPVGLNVDAVVRFITLLGTFKFDDDKSSGSLESSRNEAMSRFF